MAPATLLDRQRDGVGRHDVDGVAIADTAASVLTGSLARPIGHPGRRAGRPYAIIQGTLAADSNYRSASPAYADDYPRALTVTANPQTKVYGTADPSLTDAGRASWTRPWTASRSTTRPQLC